MPELPEVETTRRGIEPHLLNQSIDTVIVREARLRWPVPDDLKARVEGQQVHAVRRRAKYLLIDLEQGSLIIHLGMSGSLRLVDHTQDAGKHDHVDFLLDSGRSLRFRDPRRFGSIHWSRDTSDHALIQSLGPEPLSESFNADYLFHESRNRRVAIKSFIMNARLVVGVGNIYASEALFRSGISPRCAAGRLTRARCQALTVSIKEVLEEAIAQGGTTLRDFVASDGQPGYFKQSLSVYGREGEDCDNCGSRIRMIRQGQRATYFCPRCQTA